ncbi:Uncharacterized protein HA466_0017020 [Hirschfeldia incana]|nr:Uncharacterized protein HA466_0017020 [Hirschfeldia incana]
MEAATTRIFGTCALNRRLLLTKINVKPDSLCFPSRNAAAARIRCCSSLPSNPNLFKSLFSLTSNPHLQNSAAPHANPPRSEPSEGVAVWNRAPRIANGGGGSGSTFGESGKETTVVLLGWLGAKAKHLRRYVEWYNSRGINAVTFTVDVKDLFRFDLGRRLERRIDEFGNELVSWMSEREEDEGREKCLVFHSFSNTGWLVYGALLESFVGRQELVEKIKGCIIDSGGADPLDTKIWAAGFTAAILKKRSSTVNTESNSDASNLQKKEPLGIESMMLSSLEKLFPIVLNIPEVNMRLMKITQKLYENHPPCPQLYLYSSGDKVVPSHSVETRIKEQQKIGRNVRSFNFKSSPHVDHYRNFPDLYSSQLHNFLQECFKPTKQQQAV